MQQLAKIHGEVSREPTAPEQGAGAEEKEAWEDEWDGERTANGRYESALLKAQMLSVGALGEEIRALLEMEHALVTIPDPCGRKHKESDKMEDEVLPCGRVERSFRQAREKRKEQPG